MIGKKVYFIDLKLRSVKSGIVITDTISQSGYEVYIVYGTDGKRESKDLALVFDTEKAANDNLERMLKLSDDMEALNKQTEEKLNAMREGLLGKPKFKELANELFK